MEPRVVVIAGRLVEAQAASSVISVDVNNLQT
jgi:hypothetical protein